MSKYDTLNPMQREADFSHGGTTPGSGRRRFRKDARPDTPDCVFNRGKTGGAVEYHGDHIYQ